MLRPAFRPAPGQVPALPAEPDLRGARPRRSEPVPQEPHSRIPAVIELGCGPGVALAELLRAYPAARVIGADPSALVLTSARRRNARALAEGRLTLVTGDTRGAAGYAPAGLVLACHVLYF